MLARTRSVLAGRGASELELVFGRAFLVAVERDDRELATLFARAFLTLAPKPAMRNGG